MTGSKRVERLMSKEQRKQDDLFQSGQAAVGYVRVSTDEQARKGYGTEGGCGHMGLAFSARAWLV
jgi:hypothetical protein